MRKALIIGALAAVASLGWAGPASAAPGADIKASCEATFGQLISASRSSGVAVHANYAGGAHAFADPAILAAHGCSV